MEAIVAKIKSDADAAAEKILAEARREADAILKAVEGDAERIREAGHVEAERRAATERKRLVSAATLRLRRQRQALLARLADKVKEAVEAGAPALRERHAYAVQLKRDAEAALKELGREGVVKVARGDAAKVKGVKAEVREVPGLLGGCIVESKDGKVCIDHSLESKLAAAWPEAKKEVIELLVG